jgi:4-amino-4-deoxy-L-arabinose transferase-like glycosyltransferase
MTAVATQAPARRRLKLIPRSWRRTMLACCLIAFVHGALWAVISPPFQPPDEAAHVAYVFTIVADGKLPGSAGFTKNKADTRVTPDIADVLRQMPWASEGPPSWDPQEAARLRGKLKTEPLTGGPATYIAVTPPLYYALDAIPTKLASGLDIYNRLLVMRLFSSLLAAFTVGFVFLFMRELMPSRPWAWTAGALVVALQPVFGHLAGAVSVDNLLFLTGAALFYLTARAFRRGLTPKLGLALGVAAVAGALTKATIFGIFPGIAAGMLLILWRTPREKRRQAIVSLAIAAAVFALPYVVWLWANVHVFDRNAGTTTGGFTSSTVTNKITIGGQLSYTWQFFLPRLGFMHDYMTSYPYYGLWQVYVEGFVGRFGFFQYGFPTWVNTVGGSLLVAILGGGLAALGRVPGAIRRRGLEFATYALMLLGLLALVSLVGYRYNVSTGASFEQTRYLLPALCLWGALVAAASIGFSTKRFPAPAVATLMVTLVAGQAFASLLLTVGRFWGYIYQ